MRKLLVIIPFFMLLCGAQVFAADALTLFPMDKGRVWGYDDGNIDQITSILQGGNTTQVLQTFVFENYNFARRVFYRDGNKIYELKEGYRRLWYDFGADAKATWKMTWEAVAVPTASIDAKPPVPIAEIKDINYGATMTLVEKDVVMKVPHGEFKGCFHFKITRPGVYDAAYVDEWFAPEVGCIMRTWDTIAGPHTQKLAKIYIPEPVSPLRMEVTLDKDTYKVGEDIGITVSVLNLSDKPETLKFASGLQVDYVIDGAYAYSKTHGSIAMLTQVIIPARETHKWPFTYTAKDYAVPPGKHVIYASLVGTNVTASRVFTVVNSLPALPTRVTLEVKTSKDSYDQGEPILFTLTVTNNTSAAVDLAIVKGMAVRYAINDLVRLPDYLAILPPAEKVTIEVGKPLTFDMKHTVDFYTLVPGTYNLYAGLWGYDTIASTQFAVTQQLFLGTVSGIVYGYTAGPTAIAAAFVPLKEAEIKLTAVIPKNYTAQLSSLPTMDKTELHATSDENGKFTITDVPVGVFYIVTVTKDGYYSYNETIRTLTIDTMLKPILKPVQFITQRDLNYKRHDLMVGLSIYIGTDQTVYKPDSSVRATFKVTNTLDKAVTFTSAYVDWYLERQNEQPIKLPPVPLPAQGTKKAADGTPATESFTLKQNESKPFEYTYNLKGQVPDHGGKYSIRASLRFTECTITNLQSGDAADYITILVVPVVSQRIDANGHSNEMVVDMKSTQQASVNIVTKNADVSGQILVTEIKENLHQTLDNKLFIKMVEVEADADIRDNMETAVVRIYFKPEDSSKPEKLVIAHWDDKADNPKWEVLESRVDTVNNFVEATTSSFSTFGLFESDAPTAVEQTEVPMVFKLEQNVPNPFNPSTAIQFQLPTAGQVKLSVYNVVGQEVARLIDSTLPAGVHRVVFNGSRLGSGIYFYRVTGNGINATRKMLLVK